VNGIDAGAKNRVRMWLRSERAFGLIQVAQSLSRREKNDPAATIEVEHEAQPVEAPSETPAPRGLIALPVLSRDQKIEQLAAMDRGEVSGCVKCRLSQTRTRTVFGEGDADAPVMFIGEGPGMNEDRTGRPFVGRAGELLDKMIVGMGFAREQVYIANIVKCRAWMPGPPPKDRAPASDEVAACAPYLDRQVDLIRPRVIVTLGLPAAKHVLQTQSTMGRLRGVWHEWRGVKVMPTYHPAYMLRVYSNGSPDEVRKVREAVWSDLKKVLAELGIGLPSRGSGTANA